MTQKTVYTGTPESPQSLNTNFENTHDNFTELYLKDSFQDAIVAEKQDILVSGTSIKTINGESVLGSGDISIEDVCSTYNLSSPQTLTVEQCKGGVFYITNGATITLPAAAMGYGLALITDDDSTIIVNLSGSDIVRKDGTVVSSMTSPGYVGEIAVLTYHSPGTWYAATSGW